jgi:hypothetical protein
MFLSLIRLREEKEVSPEEKKAENPRRTTRAAMRLRVLRSMPMENLQGHIMRVRIKKFFVIRSIDHRFSAFHIAISMLCVSSSCSVTKPDRPPEGLSRPAAAPDLEYTCFTVSCKVPGGAYSGYPPLADS